MVHEQSVIIRYAEHCEFFSCASGDCRQTDSTASPGTRSGATSGEPLYCTFMLSPGHVGNFGALSHWSSRRSLWKISGVRCVHQRHVVPHVNVVFISGNGTAASITLATGDPKFHSVHAAYRMAICHSVFHCQRILHLHEATGSGKTSGTIRWWRPLHRLAGYPRKHHGRFDDREHCASQSISRRVANYQLQYFPRSVLRIPSDSNSHPKLALSSPLDCTDERQFSNSLRKK